MLAQSEGRLAGWLAVTKSQPAWPCSRPQTAPSARSLGLILPLVCNIRARPCQPTRPV